MRILQSLNPLSFDPQAGPEARKALRLLIVAGFFMSFGFNAWNTLFNNFAVDALRLGPDQVGLIQSLREIPGFLGFAMGFIVMLIPEMRVAGFCVVLAGVGLLVMGRSADFALLLASTLIISIGFHFYDTANQGLALTYSRKEVAPKVLGALASIGAVATLVGTVVVFILAGPLGYRPLIYLFGGVTLAGGLVVAVLGNQGAVELLPRKVVFRRRYWLYYLLTFLLGCRRHVFGTFAILLLVMKFKVDVQLTATLFLVNAVLSMLAYPQIGHLITRIGERRILILNFLLIIPVFIGYAYVNVLWLLVFLYVADNILGGFALALNTYFHKIAISHEEITSNVSMGQTINHLAAIFVPALGGLIWQLYGSQATFLASTVIVLIGLGLSFLVRVPQPVAVPATAAALE